MFRMRLAVLAVALAAAVAAASAERGSQGSLLQAGSRRLRAGARGVEEDLAEKKKEKKDLEDKLKKVESESKNTLEEIRKIEDEFSSHATKVANDPKEKEKHELRLEVARIQAQLKTTNANIATLQKQVKAFSVEYQNVEEAYRGVNSKVNELTLEAASANRSAERLEDVKAEREKQVEAARAQQRLADNALRNITDSNAAREQKIQKAISAVSTTAAATEAEVEKNKAALEELKQKIANYLSDVTVRQQKLDAETERTRDLKGRLERDTETREQLTEQLEEHRRSLAEAKAAYEDAEESLVTLRNATEALRGEVKSLTKEYRHLTELRANATEEVDKLEESTDRLTILIDEANGAIDMLHERTNKEKEAIDAEKKDREDTSAGIAVATKAIRSTLAKLHGAVDRREAAHERAKQVTSARFDLVRTVARLAIKVGPEGASGKDRSCPCALITIEEAEEAGLEEAEVTALATCQHECERRRFCGEQCRRNRAARDAAAKTAELKEQAEEAAHAAALNATKEAATEAAAEEALAPNASAAATVASAMLHKHSEAEETKRVAEIAQMSAERRAAAEETARAHQAAAEALVRAARALATLSDSAAAGSLDSVAEVVDTSIKSALSDAADAIQAAGESAAKTLVPGKEGTEATRNHELVSGHLVTAAKGISKIAAAIIGGADPEDLAKAEKEVQTALSEAADVLDIAGSQAVQAAASEEAAATGADEEGQTETEKEKVYSDEAARAFKEAAGVLGSAAVQTEKMDVAKKAAEVKSAHQASADSIRSVSASITKAVNAARVSKAHEAEAEADKAKAALSTDSESAAGAADVDAQAEDAMSKVEAQIEAAKAKAAAEGEALKAEIQAKAEEAKSEIEHEAEAQKETTEATIEAAHEAEKAEDIAAIPEPTPEAGPAPTPVIVEAPEPTPAPQASNITKDDIKAIVEQALAAQKPAQPDVSLDERTKSAIAEANATIAEARASQAEADQQMSLSEAATSGAPTDSADAEEELANSTAPVDEAAEAVEAEAEALEADAEAADVSANATDGDAEVEAAFLQARAAVHALRRLAEHVSARAPAEIADLLAWEDESQAASRHRQRFAGPGEQQALEPAGEDEAANATDSEVATENANATASEVASEAANTTSEAAETIAQAVVGVTTNATVAAVDEAAAPNGTVDEEAPAAANETATEDANSSSLLQSGASRAHHARLRVASQAVRSALERIRSSRQANATAPAEAPVNASLVQGVAELARDQQAQEDHEAAAVKQAAETQANATTRAARGRRLRGSAPQNVMAPAEDAAAANATEEPLNGTAVGDEVVDMTALGNSTNSTPYPEPAMPPAAPATEPAPQGNGTIGEDMEAAKNAVGADGDGADEETSEADEADAAATMRFLRRLQAGTHGSFLQTLALRSGVLSDSSVLAAVGADDPDAMDPEDRAAIVKAELTGIGSSIKKLESDLATAKKTAADYTKELNTKQAKKAEFDALNGQDADALKATQDTLAKALSSQSAIETDLTSSRDSTRMQLEGAQAKKRDADSKVASLTSAIDRLKRVQKSLQDAIDRAKEEKKTIAANIEATRDRAGEEKSAGLERKLELMKHQAEEEERKDEATAIRNKLVEAVAEQKAKDSVLSSRVATIDRYIEGQKTNQTDLSEKITTEADRIAKLSESDAIARSKAEEAKEKTDLAQQEEMETRAAEQDLRAVKQQMLEPQARLKADLARARAAIKEHSVKRDELLAASKTLDSELNSVRSKYAKLNKTLHALRDGNSHLHSELRHRNATAKHLSELVELNRHEAELAARVVADSKARIELLEADLLHLQKMDKATADGNKASHGSMVRPPQSEAEAADAADKSGDSAADEGSEEEEAAAELDVDAEAEAAQKKADQAEAALAGEDEDPAAAVEEGEEVAKAEVAKIEKEAEAAAEEDAEGSPATAEAKAAIAAEEEEAMEEAGQADEAEEAAAAAQVDGAGELGSALGEAIKEAAAN